jgi:hypothetical protein
MINSNKECRLNASLDPSQKMAIMIRPSTQADDSHWPQSHHD